MLSKEVHVQYGAKVQVYVAQGLMAQNFSTEMKYCTSPVVQACDILTRAGGPSSQSAYA